MALALADPDRFQKFVKARLDVSAAPEEIKLKVEQARKAKADSDLAIQNAENAVATAGDDVAKAKATRQLEEAKAKKKSNFKTK